MRRALFAAPLVAVAVASLAVHERFVLRPRHLSRRVLEHAVAVHRAALEGTERPAAPDDDALQWTPPARVTASLFRRGRAVHRVAASGPLGTAIEVSARRLARLAKGNASGTVRVDIPTARRAFVGVGWIDALAFAPAADAAGARVAGREDYVAPFDLVRIGAYRQHWIDQSLHIGQEDGLSQAWRELSKRLGTRRDAVEDGTHFRLRVASAVEGEPGRLVPARDDRPTRRNLTAAGKRGAQYLAGQLDAKGRFRYTYDPLRDSDGSDRSYNVPRHGGTTYFLAQAAGYLEEPAFAHAARRALDYHRRSFVRRDRHTGGLTAGMGVSVNTGSAALGVVAMAEYRRVTGNTRYDDAIAGLSKWLLAMQRPDGDFTHRYDRRTGARDEARLLYFTGEAALALLKAHEELGDAAYLRGAERALDYLTLEGWSFFGAEYLPGEEHWTCISANEAYPRVKKRRYLDFCRRWASHRRDAQLGRTVFDGTGGYGIAPMLVPNTTPTGSTTEATLSTALLARKWGTPDRAIERQTRRAAAFLLRRQLDGELLHLFPDPEEARGGFPASEVNMVVRIDFVQHAASALVRMTDLL